MSRSARPTKIGTPPYPTPPPVANTNPEKLEICDPAELLRAVAKTMRRRASAIRLGAVSDRHHVHGCSVSAYNVESHDAELVEWCAAIADGENVPDDFYEWRRQKRAALFGSQS